MSGTSPLRPVRVIETEWITLPDGCRLAATVWLPPNTAHNPAPAILEYLPYRRRDGTYLRDRQIHPFFAAHDYASLRVDIRGTGGSEGLLTDEYTPPRTTGRRGSHRLDRRPALVQRRRRHDRHLLGRLQIAALRHRRSRPSSPSARPTTATPTTAHMGGTLLNNAT